MDTDPSQIITRASPPGQNLLDLGCGTGKSSSGMKALGYEVTGCDISKSMLDYAKKKKENAGISFYQTDIRRLPDIGRFDVALAMDDVLNYVMSEEDLSRVFASVHRLLNPGALFCFDVNTIHGFMRIYNATEIVVDEPDEFIAWRGVTTPTAENHEIAEAHLTVFLRDSEHGTGEWTRKRCISIQKHYYRINLERSLKDSGFDVVRLVGLTQRGELHEPLIETGHNKAIWLTRRA